MKRTAAFALVRWMIVCAVAGVTVPMLRAQSAPRATVAAARPSDGAGLLWPQKVLRFANGKPVLGLPLAGGRSTVRCGSDNTAYFSLEGDSQTSDAPGVPQLFSVSVGGEVKSLMRKVPVEFNDISVRDFFVGEKTVITLLQAAKRDDRGVVGEPAYFLSSLDPDGDFSRITQLESHFTPLKIAMVSGEVLVVGWDEANLVPMLALLKDDGTIRRFLDFDEPKPNGTRVRLEVPFEALKDAALVAYGKDVLLTYPGSTRQIWELSGNGVVRSIPIAIPGGYVLHDVLMSSGSWGTIVIRVRAARSSDTPGAADESKETQRRLLEMSSNTGALLRELVPDRPKVADVACAGGSSLTAIFADTIPDASSNGKLAAAPEGAQQLVVATTRR